MNWFEVDKKGLAKLMEGRGSAFAVWELLQNCWDEDVTEVKVTLEPVPGRPLAVLTVEDDAPNGFADLSHAFTLYAESAKKADPQKRGRFNIGEKHVLALCEEATVTSTTGTIIFDKDGRSRSRAKRERGSEFRGVIRMSRSAYEEMCRAVQSVIPPEGIRTTFNGEALPVRTPIQVFDATLPTVVADSEGVLRRSSRKTTVRIYEPLEGEIASIYEMGIPVVETGDKWHVDVGQKVPLNQDLDNVMHAFLRTVRALLLNEMHESIDEEDANATWVREATSDERCSDEAIETAVTRRFGEKRVAYDPSDPEANKLAVSKGYVVVTSSQLNKQEWANVKRSGAMLPAGQVTPSPKPFSDDPNARPYKRVPEEEWTQGMRQIVAYAQTLAKELMGVHLEVDIADSKGLKASATYGAGPGIARLTFNLAYLGTPWFEEGATTAVDGLLIHEFGHQYSRDHLSAEYHEALCQLGARLKQLALTKPKLFSAFRSCPGVAASERQSLTSPAVVS